MAPSRFPYRHSSFSAAHNEACRLAQLYRTTPFTVLEAIEVNQIADVVTTPLGEEKYPF